MRPSLRIFLVNLIISISTTNSLATEFTLSIQPKHISCYGDSDGGADLSVTGGTAPFVYAWNNGEVSEDISGLAPGLYSVNVQDADGHAASACIEIQQPAPLKVNVTAPGSVCAGGTGEATVSVSGGTAPYSVAWSDGASGTVSRQLSPGNYQVEVTDASGCTKIHEFSIPEGGGFNVSALKTDVSCLGNNDGTATVAIEGTSGYSVSWSNGVSGETISGLSPGMYTATVTDNQGCTETSEVSISEPAGISASGAISYDPCAGASIDLTPSGGVPPYRFLWSHGRNTEDVSKLTDGTYHVSIIDQNGCLKSLSFPVTGVSLLKLSATVSDVSCSAEADGSVNLTVSGGSGPYSFQWNNGASTEDINNLPPGTYSVTVTDNNGCTSGFFASVGKTEPFDHEINVENITCHDANDGSISVTVNNAVTPVTYSWSDGSTGESIGNLGEGHYTVTITDANGCSKDFEFDLLNPPQLAVSTSVINNECMGGNVTVNVDGGTEPYSYQWDHGATASELSGLDPGSYHLVVTDAHGCKDSADALVEGRSVSQISVEAINISCFGANDGSASVSVSGLNGPYTYSWSNGAVSEEVTGLSKGAYTVTVSDNFGCVFTRSLAISEPASLSVRVFGTAVKCAGGMDGSAAAIISGGTSPYIVAWSDGSSTPFLSNIPAGTYTITVTDKNGCKATGETSITEPEPLEITASAYASCMGGSADLTVSGGTEPYSFVWSNGSLAEDLSGISAGNYSVTVTDINNCTAVLDVNVPEYIPLEVTATSSENTASASASGGNEPYTWLWSTGDSTQNVSGLPDGIHMVTVTDATGCNVSAEVEIRSGNVSGPVSASIGCCSDQEICKGETVSVPVTFTGTGPYTFVYKAGNELKQVTTSETVYNIEIRPYQTTTIELISVSNGCSNGTVCGLATVAVNDCYGKCSYNCFSSEVTEVIEEGDCRLIKIRISSNGCCKYGLSHLTVSVPCGKVKDANNSRKYKIEIGKDPTSGIAGFKIDNISWFGEAKDGKVESFTLEYTVCKEASDCFDDFCPPMVAFKAGQCVYYSKSDWNGVISASAPSLTVDNIPVYPNPVSSGETVTIKVEKGGAGSVDIVLVDQLGKVITSELVKKPEGAEEVTFALPGNLNAGIYFLYIREEDRKYIRNIMIKD